MRTLNITSEERAWDIVRDLATNQITFRENEGLKINFENFPHLEIKFEGEKFNHSLPVRTMEAFKTVQFEVYRIYALAAYNDESRMLTKDEKDSLELFFEIKDGSTIAFIKNIGDVFKTLGEKAVEKMDAKHVTIVLVTGVLGWSVIGMTEKIAEANTKVSIESERTKQSSEETKRMEIMAQLASQNKAVEKVLESIDHSMEAIAKSIKGKEAVVLPDKDKTKVDEKMAKELYPKSKRRKSEEMRMDGLYIIKEVKNRDGELRVTLLGGGKEYSAIASLNNKSLCEALSGAVPSGLAISLEINARDLEGEKRDLVIVAHKVTQISANQTSN